MSRAGDGMATLFVPPDRSLGWPRGVQEDDEPWGWRPGLEDPDLPVAVGGAPGDGPSGDPTDAGDLWPAAGSLVVPLARVRPVRLIVRPH
jgi:hypothetical protein